MKEGTENRAQSTDYVMIGVEHIHPHPRNPRKDLGDLTELVESIKKHGVLQNLTVIPEEGKPGEYLVLLGHRRHAAAVEAGLEKVRCQIREGMGENEQIVVMLEENMQRNDLTISEQAQSFQLMLDLGETEDSIAEKTGFSKKTICHRLSIAKLNQKELQKKEKDEGFQLMLKDLYELEKIADIRQRNKILKEASSSREIVSKTRAAILEAEKAKQTEQIIAMLEKMGVQKVPAEKDYELYTDKWEKVKEIEFSKEAPKKISMKKDTEPLYYHPYWNGVRVYKKAKKEKRVRTPEEIRRRQINKNKKRITDKIAKMTARRKEFVRDILDGKIDGLKETEAVKDAAWEVMVEAKLTLSMTNLKAFFLGKPEYSCTIQEREESQQKVEALDALHQMLIAMHYAMDVIGEIFDYGGAYRPGVGRTLMKGYDILKKYGFTFEDEEASKLLDGTHELYTKKEAGSGEKEQVQEPMKKEIGTDPEKKEGENENDL